MKSINYAYRSHPDKHLENHKLFENKLLTYKQAAIYLSLSEPYIRRLKSEGRIPYVEFGKAVRFRISSLERWVHEREVT